MEMSRWIVKWSNGGLIMKSQLQFGFTFFLLLLLLATPCLSQDIVVDTVEDANLSNELGGTWSVFEGNGSGSTGGNLILTTGAGLGGSGTAIVVSGQLPPVVGGFNYGGVQCPLGTRDISGTTILEFDILVTAGGPYKVRVEDGVQTFNSAFVNLSLTEGLTTHVIIPLSKLATAPDGGNPINFSAATNIVWDLQASGDSVPFGITIDNVKFIDPILVEDAEDADLTNELSGVWFVFEGNGVSNPSYGHLNIAPTTPGLGSTEVGVAVSGSLPPLEGGYNFGGVGCPLGTLDISGAINLEFNALVTDGGPYKVRVEDSLNTYNSAFINLNLPPNVETHVIIPLADLTTGGTPDGGNLIDLRDARQIIWDLQTPGDSSPFGLIIDNVYFTGQGTPIPTPTPIPPLPADKNVLVDDLEDGNFICELGGLWETFSGNASCPSPCGTIHIATDCVPLSGAYSFCVTGQMPPLDGYVYGGVNVRVGPTPTSSINIANHLYLQFDIKVSQGGPYRVRIEDAPHIAAGYLGYLQPHVNFDVPPNTTTTVKIPLSSFTTGPEALDLTKVATIVWVPQTDVGDDPFVLTIDNVLFIGTEPASAVEQWYLHE